MKQTDPQLKLRLPPLLKRNIQDAAERMHRTLSSEIIARLQWSFEKASGFEQYGTGSDARSKLAATRLLGIGMPSADEGKAEDQGAARLTLSDVSEDVIDYIADKVLARLQRDDEGSS